MTTSRAGAPTGPPATRTRPCAYCGTEMARGFHAMCPNCGWSVGLIPIGETRDSSGTVSVQFVAEHPVRYGRIALIMVVLAGTIMFFAGMNANFGIVVLGAAALGLGIVVWKETRFARVMYGLTPGMKILARTVLVVGTVLAFCTVVGVFVGFFGDRMFRS
jgi:hypothetical protein